ncbi:MAG: acyl-CoA dehydrogenase domain-containing protein, partial [Cyanobacteria bacterium J06642_11]
AFASLSDMAILIHGNRLKHHVMITQRFGDMAFWMHLATATLRRFEAEDRRGEDIPLVHWAVKHSLSQVQSAFEDLLVNVDWPILGGILRAVALTWLRLNPIGTAPTDMDGQLVARVLQKPNSRDHLTTGLFIPKANHGALGQLERAYQLSIMAMPVFKKITTALHNGQLNVTPPIGRIEAALRAGVITSTEADAAITAEEAQRVVMRPDSFTLAEYQRIGQHYNEEEITDAE